MAIKNLATQKWEKRRNILLAVALIIFVIVLVLLLTQYGQALYQFVLSALAFIINLLLVLSGHAPAA